eukprot:s724_g13.t1
MLRVLRLLLFVLIVFSAQLAFMPSVRTFGGPIMGQFKYLGGVRAGDGVIYGIPGHAKQVLRIDPQTYDVQRIGPRLDGKFKWLRGVLAPNGCIYGIPAHADSVLKIVPSTGSSTAELGRKMRSSVCLKRYGKLRALTLAGAASREVLAMLRLSCYAGLQLEVAKGIVAAARSPVFRCGVILVLAGLQPGFRKALQWLHNKKEGLTEEVAGAV